MPKMLIDYNYFNPLDGSKPGEQAGVDMTEIAKDYANMTKNWAELRVDVDHLKKSIDTLKESKSVAFTGYRQLDLRQDASVERLEQLEERCGDLSRDLHAKTTVIDALIEKVTALDTDESTRRAGSPCYGELDRRITHGLDQVYKRLTDIESYVERFKKFDEDAYVKFRDLQQARTYDIKQIQTLKDKVANLEKRIEASSTDYDAKIIDLQQTRAHEIKQIQILIDRVTKLEDSNESFKTRDNDIDHKRRIGYDDLYVRVRNLEHKDECMQKRADGMDDKREKADDALFIRVKELEDKIAQKVDMKSDFVQSIFARFKALEKDIERMQNDGR